MAAEDIPTGRFICEYTGEIISEEEAIKREDDYSLNCADETMACYMYFFQHAKKVMCVDATSPEKAPGYGRLINHSRKGGNLETVKHIVDKEPHLIFISKRNIKKGEEFSYDVSFIYYLLY
eukprot:TRINITY_DN4508_c0_g1_i4.p2 TRINITY_DN4508_c0_g1~~TRINITY_DN4508_c0_g1_i4.p2  ORF type:complete len:121 (+),score=30.76 TRINITY_DN4508_c0_g1_i4:129-491(+)